MADTLSAFGALGPLGMILLVAPIYYIVTRGYRALTILVRGWPPAHLDADGQWKPEPRENRE
ncbi:hypothetical protein EOD42_13925 [Rhodovarius crocodyli]|uniref:Uncharacterized protein n=1 Tax=Rhodovarius crocodyli TaxID=1979269 RepID=A0A437MEW8_9PROT|nr:hypothetical protein [Rhodovarius crocodyli]RVT96210.1 hypothetical protein EOD42_13925 [Rhodovarius crocodyli]